jgi:hypothetical protein
LLAWVASGGPGGLAVGIVVALPFVAAGMLLAMPAMLALRRAGKNSTVNYLLLGTAVGMLLEWSFSMLAAALHSNPTGGAFGAVLGLWSSAAWCLVFRGRPRSFAPLGGADI